MPQNYQITLDTVVLRQKDLQKAVAFYQLLGLKCKLYRTGQWAEFLLGTTCLALCPTDELQSGHSGLVFATKEFEALLEILQNAGHSLSERVTTSRGIIVTVTDPGGNKIDLLYPQAPPAPCYKEESCCRNRK